MRLHPTQSPDRVATTQRPGYLRQGDMRAVPADQAGEWSAVRGGGPFGLEALVTSKLGRADAPSVLERILRSLEET